MGSGAETARATADGAAAQRARRSACCRCGCTARSRRTHFLAALPRTCRAVAVLEQTKEPGAPGEPLYLDVVNTLAQAASRGGAAAMPRVIGGRYGLSSKDFNPAHGQGGVRRTAQARTHATASPSASTTMSRTPASTLDRDFSIEPDDVVQAVFYGLGADGTVGANKNSVKIIAEDAGLYAQGYFVYDSHKSGAQTISHLRFGPRPDPCAVPDPAGQLRRLPPVPVHRSGTTCCGWRHPAPPFC